MQTTDTDKALPPYLSYRTFATFVEGLKVGLPARIDRSVMKTLSGANQSWLMGALRYLKLIADDGIPTDRLRRLVNSEGTDRQKQLQEVAKGAYGFLFRDSFHLQTATPRQLDEAFTKAGPSGDTVRRCVTFFVALAKEAGLPLSPHIEKSSRASRATPRRRRVNGNTTADIQEQPTRTEAAKPLTELLLDKFPAFDPAWPDEVKTKWFAAFGDLMERTKQGN
ncbi:MAG: DUF5343 domain-containing protein [Acidobacteria bacterium]|nr:DUF5343 domain-containing protein [Acidobacteriota bacterium]